jgi:hypothetical protein
MKSTMFRLCSLTVVALAMLLTFSNCKKDVVQNDAQSDPTHLSVRKCLTQEKLNDLIHAQPEVHETRNRIEAFTTPFVKDYEKTASNRAVVTIPVVVHIVYNTAAQNISNQQIQSQLDVLNRDFRKLNADAASTPSVFLAILLPLHHNLPCRLRLTI